MPIVRVAENRVGVAGVTDAKLRASDYSGTGLEAAGQGLERLGAAGQQFAHVQHQVDGQIAEAAAKTLDNEFVQGVQAIRSEYLSQTGLNAGTARPVAQKSVKTLYDETLGRATDEPMRQMLKQALDQRVTGFLGEVDTHYRAEAAKATETASIARERHSEEEARRTTDPLQQEANIATGNGEISTRLQGKMSPEVIAAQQFEYENRVRVGIASDFIVAGNIDGAVAYLDKYKDRVSANGRATIAAMLKAPLERRETNADVDGLMGVATRNGGASFSYGSPIHNGMRTPVPGGQFNAARDYGGHQGADIPADLGTPVYATAPGTAKISTSVKGGTIVTVDHGGGNVTKYMHLGRTTIKDGDLVTPDTQIGAVGVTGRSSGPHLHYEIWKGGKPIDPEGVIGQVQQSPQRHDLNAQLAAVDRAAANGGWTLERIDRAKDEVRRRVGLDETLVARQEQDAERQAADVVAGFGAGGLKSTGQIPPNVWAALPGTTKLQYENLAKANNERPEVKPYGEAFLRLESIANEQPEQFKRLDLETLRPFMTPGEFARFHGDQSKMRATPAKPSALASIRGEIAETIRAYGEPVGLKLKSGQRPEELEAYGRVSDAMRTYLDRATDGGKRPPTDDELKKAFDSATMAVVVKGAGWLGGNVTKRRYEVPNGASGVGIPVPNAVRARIASALKSTQGTATEPEIARIYMENKGRPGFWD